MRSTLKNGASITVLILIYFDVCQTQRYIINEYQNWEGKELQMVHLLFRHGARTPEFTYPRDPNKNQTFYPYGVGQLTTKGKQDLYKVGKWLKNRYSKFLGTRYEPDLLWAESTEVPRSIMSLQIVLAGMFPPKGTVMDWNADLNWQPIATHAPPGGNDTLLIVHPCRRYFELLQKVINTWQYRESVEENVEFYKQLSHITGLDISEHLAMLWFYWTTRTEYEFGQQVAERIEKYFPHRLNFNILQSYKYYAYTEEQKRIRGGPFVKSLIKDWTQKRNGTISPINRKLFVYCGHDLTIVSVLSTLNLWKNQMPEYGIMLMFELYKDVYTGEYSIQIFLKANEESDPIPLTLPGCERLCPLDKFILLTKNIIPEDLNRSCQARGDVKITNKNIKFLSEAL